MQVYSKVPRVRVQATTWTWIVAMMQMLCWVQASVQATDSNLLEQQLLTQPQKLVWDKTASGASGRSLGRGAVERFTIIPHYDSSFYTLTSQQQKVLKAAILDSVIQWWSDVLKARPMATGIKFERVCPSAHYWLNGVKYCRGSCAPVTKCGPVTVPEEHLTPCRKCSRPGLHCEDGVGGVTTGVKGGHFLLYVSVRNEPHCSRGSVYPGTNLVEASHCLLEESFDRPVAGYINFCPHALSTDPAHLSIQQHAVMHELVHALVFSEDLFPYYHNEEGFPRSRRAPDGSIARYPHGGYDIDQNTLRLVRRSKWTVITPGLDHSVKMIVSPNVVREVREHFDCPTLIGAELENQGGVGIAGVHWESRLFGEELMTATLNSRPVLSRVTLALMQDSGWYLPDYSYAGHLLWGQKKGCVFADDSCGGWMKHADENRELLAPFCDGLDFKRGRMGCVNGRMGVGPCLIQNYAIPLPLEYQYLSRRKGGTRILADYCPLFGASEYGNTRIGRSCLNPVHAPPTDTNFALEIFGSESRCIEQARPLRRVNSTGMTDEEDVANDQKAVCYKVSCNSKKIYVHIGDKLVPCGREGRKQSFEYVLEGVTYRGSIVCPAYSDICLGYDCINSCSDHGTCYKGQCRCNYGYFGEDCSQSYAQRLLSCDAVTCLNGGNCTNLEDAGFKCECPSGYTGAFCEQEQISDPCVGVTCSGNGYCTRTGGGRDAQCNCYPGYEGRACALFKDLCAASGEPCQNNHSCIVNTTQCDCTSKYWGTKCENRVNFCAPISPCSVGEICIHHNDTQNYSCVCPEGYTGVNCSEFIVDHCAKSPCSNNGTCINGLDRFKCVCPRGYKGGRCRNRQNPCKVSPCGVGGRCRKVVDGPWGSVYCRCSKGYNGEFCDTFIGS